MSATRLQRWALFLGAHSYNMEFKGTKQHDSADVLSRLPLAITEEQKPMVQDKAEIFHTTLVDQLPVTNAELWKETQNNPTL